MLSEYYTKYEVQSKVKNKNFVKKHAKENTEGTERKKSFWEPRITRIGAN